MSEGLQVLAGLVAAVLTVSLGVFLSALATRRAFHRQEESRARSVRETLRELWKMKSGL